MTDKPIKKCPRCGNRVRRLISAGAGFIFKGSGFYITDYKKNSSPAQMKNGPKSENKSEEKK